MKSKFGFKTGDTVQLKRRMPNEICFSPRVHLTVEEILDVPVDELPGEMTLAVSCDGIEQMGLESYFKKVEGE